MSLFDDLAAETRAQRVAVQALDAAAQGSVEAIVRRAVAGYTQRVVAVARNNAEKTALEVLGRRDVQAKLAQARQQLLDQLARELRDSYRGAGELGIAHVNQLLFQAGLPPSMLSAERRTAYLDSLQADVQRNVEEAMRQAVGAVVDVWDQPLPESSYQVLGGSTNPRRDQARRRGEAVQQSMETVVRRLSLRARFSAGAAVVRGHAAGKDRVAEELVAQGVPVEWEWVANYENGHQPCDYCDALNGTRVPVGTVFPTPPGLRVYLDLKSPPAHPRCQCDRVLVLPSLDAGTASRSRGPASPTFMTSAQVRQMQQSRFAAVAALFTAIVSRLRGRRGR